ncbi:Exodeoxyribonuclease V, gamma subunit [Acidithiobacillus ferrivorans]|uniref:RecBCD enzyme subunit RecC n=1 Tax=Acidithiobacillus ferrivorans TaxID=160808 RepID=A0A060USI4_9PROT|nr:exodeoxyribonuclease V subunit gamma [Acidithiobacillus ferrivorans]CDQ11572.1 putative exodeoxyribonuclease V, gamma subunit recC [Acidithiobacillus ferrivorans]SMH66144.1 Exodeoxyribonuclease V, gamma subunit [Acidithiobacillus ferrivorans]
MSHPEIEPGFIVLHGDRLEWLSDAILEWLREHPLQPLEGEIFLVQSNGIAEWLQWTLAAHEGICAAVRVALPGRFLWDSYGRVLGTGIVATRSPLDKAPLTWRLMRLLPELLPQPDFAPLRHFLGQSQRPGGALERRWQMAAQIADLFDQYQVYRGDWLADWAADQSSLRRGDGERMALPADQRWQSRLWSALRHDLQCREQDQALGRAQVHDQFLAALNAGQPPATPLPRRVILFGAATLPEQSLTALAALGQQMQVILAVPNPCRYHWADIVSGRELLRRERRRQALRNDRDLSAVAPTDLHAESNPLLAAWGRQGRDFLNLLDQFDETAALQQQMDIPRIDLFSEDQGGTLLRQLQVQIRDLEGIRPETCTALDDNDHSVVFHIAHSALREVQILHDQLLDRFATGKLQPRDVIVMMPEIASFAPLIRATFDQYDREDKRYIPYHIVDLQARDEQPLLQALDWLLHLPEQRCRQSEIRDLLNCPALRQRFALELEDLPIVQQWLTGAGWRWGLSAQQRAALGLPHCGPQNSGAFALQRLCLGYANGDDSHFADIEAYGEVGGLDAALLGPLSQLLEKLEHWQHVLAESLTPEHWGEAARALLTDFFSASDDDDAALLQNLEETLRQWQADCAAADFNEALPLAVFRGAWLEMLDAPDLGRSFLGGGVTFCTLLPMRAVPYPLVCLLGMNEGDYPRRSPRLDFDLMALPGMARPGDRSRRDDDRYLMLEALLAARQGLYISWAGKDQRNNRERAPSLLVTQLQDAMRSGWPLSLEKRTFAHPLQPFSLEYLLGKPGLRTWAREWYPSPHSAPEGSTLPNPAEFTPRRIRELLEFFRLPARAFYRQRLRTDFNEEDLAEEDDEPFTLNGLETYHLLEDLLRGAEKNSPETTAARVQAQQRSGQYPLAGMAARTATVLLDDATAILAAWREISAEWAAAPQRPAIIHAHGQMLLEDWLPALYQNNAGDLACIQLRASRLLNKDSKKPEGDKLAALWLQQLLASATGLRCAGIVVGRDVLIRAAPLQLDAMVTLDALLDLWQEGLCQPLPVTLKTALVSLQGKNPSLIYDGNNRLPGEVQKDLSLFRDYPDFTTLSSTRIGPGQRGFADYAEALYRPFADWLETLEWQAHP